MHHLRSKIFAGRSRDDTLYIPTVIWLEQLVLVAHQLCAFRFPSSGVPSNLIHECVRGEEEKSRVDRRATKDRGGDTERVSLRFLVVPR